MPSKPSDWCIANGATLSWQPPEPARRWWPLSTSSGSLSNAGGKLGCCSLLTGARFWSKPPEPFGQSCAYPTSANCWSGRTPRPVSTTCSAPWTCFQSRRLWEQVGAEFYDFIVVDEVHHGPAFELSRHLRQVHAARPLGTDGHPRAHGWGKRGG